MCHIKTVCEKVSRVKFIIYKPWENPGNKYLVHVTKCSP